jgi:methionyl-tRNA synthetase
MTSRVLAAVAWPYANGPRHIGHVSGFGVPSDIFSRYMRMSGHDVLMISGTDEHGTPILVQAEREGLTPRETADKYNRVIVNDLRDLGLSYDLFTRTVTRNHYAVSQQLFLGLHRNGYVVPKITMGAVSPSTGRTLPDRYIEGTCPICGYPSARGDQCDNCGNQLDPIDLINPVSRINGETPKFVETEHYFLDLPALAGSLGKWLSARTDWRPNVLKFSQNLLEDLRPRAITRDLDWGVPVPLDGWRDQPMKRLYVWFDAVIGYLSASVEWAKRSGDPDAWQRWWIDPDARSYYFMGKDHGGTVGPLGELRLPDELVSSEYLTMSGSKFSTSRGKVIYVGDFLRDFGPDALRYYIAVAGPETADTDFTWDEFLRRTNFELANEWGNLVNRSISMAYKNNGAIPAPNTLLDIDHDLLRTSREAFDTVGALLGRSRFKLAITEAMRLVGAANKYISDTEPWKLAGDPERRDTVLHTALQVVSDANTLLTPFLPHAAQQVHQALGGTGVWAAEPEIREVDEEGGPDYPVIMGDYDAEEARWDSHPITPGTPLQRPRPLFAKLDESLGESGPEWAPIKAE